LPPEDLQLSGTILDSDAPAGTVVGVLSATDLNNDPLTFTLTGDSADLFEIVGNELRTRADIDLDPATMPSVSVNVTVNDPGGLSTSETFDISVEDINSPPDTIALSGAAVDENAAIGTVVGVLSAHDHEGDAITYSLVDDVGGRFTIVGNELRVNGAIDYEQTSNLTVVVAATDAQGNSTDKAFAIAVGDVAELPSTEPAALVTGLGGTSGFGENFLGRNDDGSTGAIDITAVFENGLNFFGNRFDDIYVNNNGNITFGGSLSTFTPFGISDSAIPIIAPFFSDVDTRSGAVTASPGGTSTGSNLTWYDVDAGTDTVTITWDDVGYYSNKTDALNSFQMQLIDTGNGNFSVVFRYEDINWTTGDASGGVGGHSGTVARAGYSAGDGTNFVELPQSGNEAAMLSLDEVAGNTGSTGVWRFDVVNGQVVIGPVATGDVVDVTGTGPVTIDAVANDYDPDGGTLTLVSIGSDPSHGTASIVDGKIIYVPTDTGFYSDTLSYVVQDDENVSTTGLVTIVHNNDAPDSVDVTKTVLEDGSYAFSISDFAFSDVNGNGFEGIKITTLPTVGSLTLNGTAVTAGQVVAAADIGGLTWAAAHDVNGTHAAAFEFQVMDNGGTAFGGVDTDQIANVFTFDVTPVNDPPVGQDNVVGLSEDTPYAFSAADFTFTDPDGDSLAVVVISELPATGTLTLNGHAVVAGESIDAADIGGLVWTPPLNGNGSTLDSLKFTVVDDGGTSNGGVAAGTVAGTITFSVAPVNDAPVIAADEFTVQAEGQLTLDAVNGVLANDFDVDGDTLTVVSFVPPANMYGTIDSDGAGVIGPNAGFIGDAVGSYTVSDGTVEKTVTITVHVLDNPPTVATAIAAQAATEDAAFSFAIPAGTFADVDVGDTLTYAATLGNGDPLPTWLHFNAATGVFSGTPANGDVGSISVKVTATDSHSASVSDTFAISIANTNDAPTVAAAITDQAATEDASFSFAIPADTFADVDLGDTLSYAATLANGDPLTTWLHFNAATGVFSGTPANGDVGTISVKVTATDSHSASVSDTFAISIANTNDAPTVAAAIAAQSATEDTAFTYTIPAGTFADVDLGDTLSYTATLDNGDPLPTWLHFDTATGTFSGTPANGDVGTISVKVTATDSSHAAVSDTFAISIANTNDAPTVAAAITDQAATEDASFSFAIPAGTFADVDVGDTLTYAATLANGDPLPAWLHFNAATGTFSGTPANGDVGTISVKVTATDSSHAAVSDTFAISIANTNNAPTVATAIAAQSATEDTAFTYTIPAGTFADVDLGDTLSYAATLANGDPLPAWLHFNAATGTFSGTPANGDVGTISVKVTATDSHNASVSDTFAISIANTNDAPTVATAIAAQSATEDTAFTYTIPAGTFADVDLGDTLSYAATLDNGDPLPTWLHFDTATGTFSGTPANGDVGTISVKVTAVDGDSVSVSDTFDINIANTNDAPTDIALSATSIKENADPGTIVGALSAVDPDLGDTLTYKLTSNPGKTFSIVDGNIVLAQGKSLNFEIKDSYDITVRVTDDAGASYDESFTINVTDVDEVIRGTRKNDILHGTDADDVIQGLAGNDTLDGAGGADELDGGNGSDAASYQSAAAGVTVNLSRPVKNTGDADGDSYVSIENLIGSRFNDKLIGNNKENELDGGKGDDILTGGAQGDLFIFGAKYGKDTVTDFDFKGSDHDVIDLTDAAGITSFKDLIKHHIQDTGHDLVINASDGSKLVLEDVHSAGNLVKSDFLL
jgi:uncharacterized protein with PIN domain